MQLADGNEEIFWGVLNDIRLCFCLNDVKTYLNKLFVKTKSKSIESRIKK
jgi:hypothetical protein